MASSFNYEAYETLIRKLERQAEANPGAYSRKVRWLTYAGYGYIYLILLLGLACLGLAAYSVFFTHHLHAVVVKLVYVLLVVLILVIRTLWFKLEPPSGQAITTSEAPELFALIREVNERLGGPRIDHVLITDDLNASMAQVPRFGLFGFHRSYLSIGLPLLQALSKDQLRIVIAHEIGHLTGNHSKAFGLIYRTRATWSRLLERLEEEQRGWATAIFAVFYKRYIPYYMAYTFVYARQNEYEADRQSAVVGGPAQTAEALMAIHIHSRAENRFWNDLFHERSMTADVPADIYDRLKRHWQAAEGQTHVQAWRSDALEEATDLLDTHPSLHDRIRQLGVDPADVTFKPQEGASGLLGSREAELTQRFNREWASQVNKGWSQRYKEKQESLLELEQLRARQDELEGEELLTLAHLTERFESSEAARSIYETAAGRDPELPAAHFHLGRLLLELQDDAGIARLERAYAMDDSAIVPACRLIVDYLIEHGREDEADPYKAAFFERVHHLEQADEERGALHANDTYIPHTLTRDELEALRKQLAGYSAIRKAYLVQKEVQLEQHDRLFALAIQFKRPWNTQNDDKFDAELLQSLQTSLDFPYSCFYVLLTIENYKFGKAVKNVPGALIYEK
ncbi:M48 family metalloprotease [Paenibacillus aurantiacus]|uniref:M48 family metalloprotease n=1 Tax=Paenibacillus aurantiacus TaxID=1936118 RepID=A0ABV5L0U4_9BACL